MSGKDSRSGSADIHTNRRSGTEQHSGSLPESVNEALFLFITAGLGLVLNVAVIACILVSRRQRKVTNSFVVHGCALDAIKCAFRLRDDLGCVYSLTHSLPSTFFLFGTSVLFNVVRFFLQV